MVTLDKETMGKLNVVLVEQIEAALPSCKYRGCPNKGRFYLRRIVRANVVQEGLFCNGCDLKFGEQNLRRAAREMGGKLTIMRDSEGEFPAILV